MFWSKKLARLFRRTKLAPSYSYVAPSIIYVGLDRPPLPDLSRPREAIAVAPEVQPHIATTTVEVTQIEEVEATPTEAFLAIYRQQMQRIEMRAQNAEDAATIAKSQAMRTLNQTYYGGRSAMHSSILQQCVRMAYDQECESIDHIYQTAMQTAEQICADAQLRLRIVMTEFSAASDPDQALPAVSNKARTVYDTPLWDSEIKIVFVKEDPYNRPFPTPRRSC